VTLHLETFLQNCLCSSTWGIANHFRAIVSQMKDILEKELELTKWSPRMVPHFLGPDQMAACVEASEEIMRILQESEVNQFGGIAEDNESWFRYFGGHSKMFARSPAEIIPRMRQVIAATETTTTAFVTTRKLIVLIFCQKSASIINYIS
jgi:hypothetical protein